MYKKVYVEIINTCNMRCTFCHGHHRKAGMLTEENFRHILTQLKGKTQYIYYHLMGEPLLHPLLPRFLQMAKAEGFHSCITTNGTLLNKYGDAILAAGLHKVSISLHSFEEGSVVDQADYLKNVCAFAEKAAANGTIISLRLWNKGFDNGKNDVTEQLLREFLPGEWAENARGLRIRDKLFLEWGNRFQWPDENAPEYGEKVFCYGLRDQFGILCDGTVVPCCLDSEGVINLGNIFREDLENILRSPRATAIRDGFSRRCAAEELCRRCGYAQRFS